jgi:two-component system, OmpR family, sensor kinase
LSAPATLGRGLGRSFALATIYGMVLFGVAMGLMIYFTELGERCTAAGQIEDPPLEIVEQTSLAFAFALPFGIAIAVRINRRLTHRTTERIDEVIASASSMTGEKLADRLPVSDAGDPLDQLSIALNGVLQRIETGVRAQAQFAADASHELRTPLTVISTNLEVARRKERAPSHWEHVADDTLAEVRRMNVLVDKLLELARAGEAGLKHERTDLRELGVNAIARAQQLATNIGVALELAPGAASYADVDAEAIAIVLDNLIRNAIDHSPKGTAVIVTVGPGQRLVVEDRGTGVPPETRERIFEPFARGVHRIDRSTGPGLGLGLAICKRIVDGHRGSIHVEDRPGGGARFVVALRDGVH